VPSRFLLALIVLSGFLSPACAAPLETVVVTGSALPGANIDVATIPVHVQTLDSTDLDRLGPSDLLGAMARDLAGVSLADAQDNAFQPNVLYRGFEASSLVGDAQGLAVYVDGVRFNQPFGDNVEWSMIPDGAVAGVTLEGANPVFGLNALGGSLSLSLKDGFGFSGIGAQVSGGSFGRGEASFDWGGSDGSRAGFVAADLFHDDGWRQHSPSSLARLFANLAWRGDRSELHLDVIAASNSLTGNGTAPVELLAARRSAVFTYPDNTQNLYGLVNLTGVWRPGATLTLSANLYLDGLARHTRNGDASDAEVCAPPDDAFLCLDDGAFLTGSDGNPIADFLSGGPYAQLNLTRTETLGVGGALQAAYQPLPPLHLLAGLAIDHGHTDFSASSLIGALTPTRGFGGPGIVIDQPDLVIAPVKASAGNTYYGFYVQGGVDLTAALRLDLSARYNIADIVLRDRLGSALDGSHRFTRLNPAVGLSYRLDTGITAHADYAEANRTPTPAEFSCADAAAPCSLTNFFVGDPDLKQVVARTYEIGLRGQGAGLSWQIDAYRSDTGNDILFTASTVRGRAFFRNIGATRRQGIEANASWREGRWSLSAAYNFTDAVFRSPVTLNSPDNPLADADGHIFVVPGDRLPSIPRHLLKLSAGFALTPDWDLTLAARYAGGVYLQGDEANLNPPTSAYTVFDAGVRWRPAASVEVFATVENLFDRAYETFGAFSPTADVPIAEAPGAGDPRSLSPAAPRTVLLGLRLH